MLGGSEVTENITSAIFRPPAVTKCFFGVTKSNGLPCRHVCFVPHRRPMATPHCTLLRKLGTTKQFVLCLRSRPQRSTGKTTRVRKKAVSSAFMLVIRRAHQEAFPFGKPSPSILHFFVRLQLIHNGETVKSSLTARIYLAVQLCFAFSRSAHRAHWYVELSRTLTC